MTQSIQFVPDSSPITAHFFMVKGKTICQTNLGFSMNIQRGVFDGYPTSSNEFSKKYHKLVYYSDCLKFTFFNLCFSLVLVTFEAITIPMLLPFFKISHMVSLFLIKSTNRNNGKIILVTPFLGEVKQK